MNRKERVKKGTKARAVLAGIVSLCLLGACAAKGSGTDAESKEVGGSTGQESGSDGLSSEAGGDGMRDAEGESGGQGDDASSDVRERYQAILLGEEGFVHIVNDDHRDRDKRMNLENIKEVVSDEDWVTARVSKFAIIDLDGNGEEEIVLWIRANEHLKGLDWGVEVLYSQEQEVYGFSLPSRAFCNLKEDGTFEISGGMDESGVGRLRLTGSSHEVERISCFPGQAEKADAVWHDLTADGVEAAFESGRP